MVYNTNDTLCVTIGEPKAIAKMYLNGVETPLPEMKFGRVTRFRVFGGRIVKQLRSLFMRSSTISRKTGDTDITLSLSLDDSTPGQISSGNGFLDHMLNLFQIHGGIHLDLDCKGDVHVDMHHSMEDIAIVLGQALVECLGDKKGIERYGFYFVPMDEALSRVCIDFSNRIGFVWNVKLPAAMAGGIEASMFEHFFKSLCENGKTY